MHPIICHGNERFGLECSRLLYLLETDVFVEIGGHCIKACITEGIHGQHWLTGFVLRLHAPTLTTPHPIFFEGLLRPIKIESG
jgi:hypothetical protein